MKQQKGFFLTRKSSCSGSFTSKVSLAVLEEPTRIGIVRYTDSLTESMDLLDI